MEKYINDSNKECWRGVDEGSPFNGDDFHMPEYQPEAIAWVKANANTCAANNSADLSRSA